MVLSLMVTTVVFQRDFIYYPNGDADPGAVGLKTGEDISFITADGLTLKAWFVKPTVTSNNIAVLFAHGNAEDRSGGIGIAQALAHLGYSVLLMDYRGYGGNPGHPSQAGIALDASAAAGWLHDHGFPASRTVYVGESLGTAVVTQLAASDPPAALLLRSPFTSLSAVVDGWVPLLGTVIVDRFDTLGYLPKIRVPVTVLCGSADTMVPASQSRTVADHVSDLYRFVELPDVGHNDDVWEGSYLAQQIDDLAKHAIG